MGGTADPGETLVNVVPGRTWFSSAVEKRKDGCRDNTLYKDLIQTRRERTPQVVFPLR